ncbi:hypothetical protein [Deinococcus cellulosilyticus]|uniref:Uncharacterized protein n=1 Tax=Deinococcus cellulosilyticus (strain DSM 18568 / NBRC 106333 / KACC 11606 / 5516J-15) TaxID=1223518 RepID=A0A511N1K0_DEIC1|nr:hypothetical protein [Deinococcus cellulosilyticus]GEM46357.1 hypothetical protein DC3_19920 [Deinococcus cellulosilyticus NBRC 106333 = KACC 11606]
MKPHTRTHKSTLQDLKLQRALLTGYLNKLQELSPEEYQRHLQQDGESLEMLQTEVLLLEAAMDALSQLEDFQQGRGLVFKAWEKGELF